MKNSYAWGFYHLGFSSPGTFVVWGFCHAFVLESGTILRANIQL